MFDQKCLIVFATAAVARNARGALLCFEIWPNDQTFCYASKFQMFDQQYLIVWSGPLSWFISLFIWLPFFIVVKNYLGRSPLFICDNLSSLVIPFFICLTLFFVLNIFLFLRHSVFVPRENSLELAAARQDYPLWLLQPPDFRAAKSRESKKSFLAEGSVKFKGQEIISKMIREVNQGKMAPREEETFRTGSNGRFIRFRASNIVGRRFPSFPKFGEINNQRSFPYVTEKHSCKPSTTLQPLPNGGSV